MQDAAGCRGASDAGLLGLREFRASGVHAIRLTVELGGAAVAVFTALVVAAAAGGEDDDEEQKEES